MIKKDYTGYSFKVAGFNDIWFIEKRCSDTEYIITNLTVNSTFTDSILHTNRNIHVGLYVLFFNPRIELRKRLKNEIV